MRLGWTKTKYSVSYYVQKTIYVNGKNKSLVVKRLGSEKYICQTYGVTDAKAWAKEQVRLMNKAEKEDSTKFSIELCAGADLAMDERHRFNGGYLFLQDIYYALGLDKICRAISSRHLFEYDLNDILSRLIYTRILYPSSKKSSFEDSRRLIEQPSFDFHDVYRALSVIAEESDYIQSRLFKNSTSSPRGKPVLSITTARTFILRLNRPKTTNSTAQARKTARFPLWKWGCSWTWKVFQSLSGYRPGMTMNRTP